MTNKWKAKTSNIKNRPPEPDSYELAINHGTRASMHKHIDEPGVWFLSVYGSLTIDKERLRYKDPTAAKYESCERILDLIENLRAGASVAYTESAKDLERRLKELGE